MRESTHNFIAIGIINLCISLIVDTNWIYFVVQLITVIVLDYLFAKKQVRSQEGKR